MLGGVLVTLDLAGLGWRVVFFVNVPFGVVIIAAALKIMPTVPRRAGTRLDISGAIVLFTGLLCLIGPLLFGHDVHWSPWVWLVMAAGAAILAGFVRLERSVARRGGMPLIDLALLSDLGVHARAGRRLLFLLRQSVVLSDHDHVHATRLAYSAAARRPGLRAACADLRRRLAA